MNDIKDKSNENENNAEPYGEGGTGFSGKYMKFVVLGAAVVLASGLIAAGLIGVIIAILIISINAATLVSFYVYFAPRDLFYTGDREGTAKAIMVGTRKDPKFVRMIMNSLGSGFAENWDIVPVTSDRIRKKTFVDFLDRLLPGLYFVGLPWINWVYKYKFSWTSETQEGQSKTKSEILDYIYVKRDIYISRLEGVEVGLTFVPVDIQINITALIKNPYKALFRVENWLEYIINIIKVLLRDFVGQVGQLDPGEEEALKKIENSEERNEAETDLRLKKALKVLVTSELNLGEAIFKKLEESGDIDDFKKDIGVEVLKVQTPDIDFGKFQELALAQFRAHQEGAAEIIKQTKAGEAYVAYRQKQKEGDINYLKGVYAEIREFGDVGLTLRFIDSLIEAAKGPSNTIIPFGFVENIAQQVLGRKQGSGLAGIIGNLFGEEITKQDIEDFKEFLNSKKKTR